MEVEKKHGGNVKKDIHGNVHRIQEQPRMVPDVLIAATKEFYLDTTICQHCVQI